MTITGTITHDHQGGTLLDIEDLRPHPKARGAVKAAGFRWSRNVGWYRPRSRDTDLTTTKLAGIEATLASAGIEIDAAVDNERQSFETKLAAQTQRASDRAQTQETKAARHQTQADSHAEASSTLAGMIPMGQPVLVGHHSAPAHTRHLAKIRTQLEKAADAGDAAKQARQRATSNRHSAQRGSDGTFLVNRLLEAERNKDTTTVTEILEYMAKQGFSFVDPATIEAGQRWHVRRSHVVVVKVNRKTVTCRALDTQGNLIFPESITNRIDLRYFHTGRDST